MNNELSVRQQLIKEFTIAMIANPGGKKEKVQAAADYADLILKDDEPKKQVIQKRVYTHFGDNK